MSMEAILERVSPTGTKLLPNSSKKRTPQAAAMPQPPSLVALPPSPTITLKAPWARASRSSSPTP